MRRLSRRGFLRTLAWSAAIPAVAGMAYAYAKRVEPWALSIERVELRSPRVPPELDGVTIGQLSDLHIGGATSQAFVRAAVRTLVDLKPDLLALTGDLVHVPGMAESVAATLRDFRAPLGSYITLGNHDHWHDADAVAGALRQSGHIVMQNHSARLHINGAPLHIVGVDDVWEKKHRLSQALSGVTVGEAALLLVHEPDVADNFAPAFPFIAQLSGHTHGGQVRLPFIGAPARAPFGRKYVMGQFDVQGMRLYVSRGVGMAEPYVRFLCPPEVTLLTLRRG